MLLKYVVRHSRGGQAAWTRLDGRDKVDDEQRQCEMVKGDSLDGSTVRRRRRDPSSFQLECAAATRRSICTPTNTEERRILFVNSNVHIFKTYIFRWYLWQARRTFFDNCGRRGAVHQRHVCSNLALASLQRRVSLPPEVPRFDLLNPRN
ncbi:hypothetical protein SAICODRAFT_133869 [Saitoella complicata NRRL Y-17804]|uniref:uncharacterized protein n=1 Tax=Saitoella complicata (strain BCRC 22490 / CBS 7301 / JCM 7358 / NBRC 10748 / NRRL Y-17804) TaxID=698492 RepID=UPI00086802EF|nr:uncharacterized protein SAICODRAFT_133869 [Saitoella complicata NRRL Y-17804]ODQ52367.1 hypothetical protein SAICODRAFT_133869 [Saitoella complicata NRRL Y-17804]